MRAAVGAVVLGVLLVGCSSGGARFEVDDLAAGACTQAGPALAELERTQRELGAGDLDAAEAAAGYEDLQDQLLAARDEADQEVGDPLRALVTSLGVFRLGVAAGTTSEVQQQELSGRLDAALQACGAELD